MRKYLALLLTLFSFLIIVPVQAEETCTYKEEAELREKASNIKVDYEMDYEEYESSHDDIATDGTYFYNINVTNITKEFYVEVTNDINGDKKLLSYSEEDNGITSFRWDNIDKITNFTFKVYTTAGNKCNGVALRTIHWTSPRYNKYAWRCADEFPDYSLCQQFVTFDEITEYEFFKRLEAYRESVKKQQEKNEENKSIVEKVIEFVDKYKWVVFGVVIVTGAGTCTYLYFSRKKQRDLGL